ncbi:TIGR03084 family metal-binding protein [Modestobacter excelsi]|uniref:TIGR03084 family metal-binding protein n=1 Tax=Modestobacter excelsi TaxID=2213161 RepID=UPI00110D21AD|nr:TIGR03084 family metal-binding protein [Modestobacter excelsi]
MTGPDAYAGLLDDLRAEQQELAVVLDGLDDEQWARDTAAEGWKVRDQVFHLARFDELGALSVTDPVAFRERRDAWQADVAGSRSRELVLAEQASRVQTLSWWHANRGLVLDTLRSRGPKDRIEWWGPSMSARSFATARLMETWVHGWDVQQAVGVSLPATDRLKHTAQLGFITRAWSYANQGRTAPDTPVRVRLTAPSGAVWDWGPADARESIAGSALDFALVVTQRRNVEDVDLQVVGADAHEWMRIAQCFAGPATTTQRGR